MLSSWVPLRAPFMLGSNLDWSSAICRQEDSTKFVYIDKEHPLYDDVIVNDDGNSKRVSRERRWNLSRMTEAAESCWDCPLMIQCGEEATELDKFWTVRGGELPTLLKEGVAKGNAPSAEIRPYLPDVCARGHSAWLPRPDGRGRYCSTCNRGSED